MSMSVYAAIFVGLPRGELENSPKVPGRCGGIQEFIDEHNLESCPPYFDGYRAAVVGFEYKRAGGGTALELEWNQEEIDKLKAEFKEVTGLDAKVYLSPKVF